MRACLRASFQAKERSLLAAPSVGNALLFQQCLAKNILTKKLVRHRAKSKGAPPQHTAHTASIEVGHAVDIHLLTKAHSTQHGSTYMCSYVIYAASPRHLNTCSCVIHSTQQALPRGITPRHML
eukprot:jgi/Ulvmu1/6590/UM003_0227.1